MMMHKPRVAPAARLALAAAVLAAAPATAQEIVGTYQLRSVGGAALPAPPTAEVGRAMCEGNAPGPEVLVESGVLTVTRNGDLLFEIVSPEFCPPVDGMGAQAVLFHSGQVRRSGASLLVDGPTGPEPVEASVDGAVLVTGALQWARIAATVDTDLWQRRSWAPNPGLESRRQAAQEYMDAAGFPYRCDGDPLLRDSAPTAAEDTAGLAQRLASAAPGWRLPTEREIACNALLDPNMAESAGSHPIDVAAELGTGRAWWVRRGDFDGDQRTDVVALVVPTAGPTSSRWAFLLAAGGARVVEAAGWGDLAPAGTTVHTCAEEGEQVLATDAMQGTALWRWKGGSPAREQTEYCGY